MGNGAVAGGLKRGRALADGAQHALAKPGVRAWVAVALGLAALTLVLFGDVLFLSGDAVLSDSETDVALYYAYFQQFGYEELRRGNVPLWNPYLFSGQPYVGSFDTAILYPLNLFFLVLPLAKAINVDFALHTLLAGLFMALWTARRGLRPLACFTAGALLMTSGPFFMHIYGGHPTIVRAMAWAPLIFASIDGVFARPGLRWALVGMLAFAMQLLTGNMQYVFYTGIAAGVYSVLRLARAEKKLYVMTSLGALVLGGICLAAAQLFTGIDAAAESVRSGRVPYAFAAMFSFPPENLLTFLVPGIFGDMIHCEYWGRCYLWEMQAYFGITGLTLAVYGAVWGRREVRRYSFVLVVTMILLALGSHTPMFRVLYAYVPGFDNFRGNSKFMFQAMLFLIMLSAAGLDALMRGQGKPQWAASLAALLAVALGAGALVVWLGASRNAETWSAFAWTINATRESYFHLTTGDVIEVGRFAAKALAAAAAVSALVALCLALVPARAYAVKLVVALAVVEVAMFAFNARATFPLERLRIPDVEAFYAETLRDDPDARVLQLDMPNHAMWARVGEMWGHDSYVLKRYAQFMAFTRGIPPDRATSYLSFDDYHPWYKLVRTKYVLQRDERGLQVNTVAPVLERFHLVHDFRVMNDRDTIFNAMANPSFNPLERVILEGAPAVRPEPGAAPGSVRLVDEGTDHLEIEVETPRAALLLITDSYSSGWRARGLEGSVQQEYDVMPANYILRAIPLERGTHRILVEYSPWAFRAGKWGSAMSVVVFVALVVFQLRITNQQFVIRNL